MCSPKPHLLPDTIYVIGDPPSDKALGTATEGEKIWMTANFTGDVAEHITLFLGQNGAEPTIPCPQLTVVMDAVTKLSELSCVTPAGSGDNWRFKVKITIHF